MFMKLNPHLNKNFLSMNSPWDFEKGLDTIKPNWVCSENKFANKNTGYGKKMTSLFKSFESKSIDTFALKIFQNIPYTANVNS